MQTIVQSVTCTLDSVRRDFRVISFTIDPRGLDGQMVEDILVKAAQHGATTLNPSGVARDSQALQRTRYLGTLSEVLLQQYLQDKLGVRARVTNAEFTDIESHIDLVIEANGKEVSVEVRGSFPYSRFENVICELFDMIGPYATSYKPGEVVKDFYLRTLINQRVQNFDPHVPHVLYFAGGAEQQLFRAIGHVTNFKQRGALYLAIKPIARGRDAIEVVHLIQDRLGRA